MFTASCDWEDCQSQSTHTVQISFPDADDETWRVCRSHDRELKFQVPRSRPKAERTETPPPVVTVQCGQCRGLLEEPFGLAEEDQQPCPNCGSTSRETN